MKSYSPYDVKPQAYPNMYISTGLHDSQVQYWDLLNGLLSYELWKQIIRYYFRYQWMQDMEAHLEDLKLLRN
jgi:hypothetical protein